MKFPDSGHSYALEVDGWVITQITEVSTPARGQVTLTRRLSGPGLDFETWLRDARFGGPRGSRRDGTLIVYDVAGRPVGRFLLRDAWPASLLVGRPAPADSGVRTERLVVTFVRIEADL
jgi:hypothetical protein